MIESRQIEEMAKLDGYSECVYMPWGKHGNRRWKVRTHDCSNWCACPWYLTDYNAIQGVMANLNYGQLDDYELHLSSILSADANHYDKCFSDIRRERHRARQEQRVEAILKATGKWEN